MKKQHQLELEAAKNNADELICQAEKSKADILKPAGEINKIDKVEKPGMMDDEFFLQTSHVKPALVEKIEKGEFVDLVELLPREKYIHNPDGRVHLVNKEGAPQFVTTTEKEPPMINSLRRWEQAFEIFATIYMHKFPEKAPELFQYKFNIKEAASVYIWDNVYRYDIAFRQLMALNQKRKWNVILQQGWSLFLKEKIERGNHFGSNSTKKKFKKPKNCWHFNRGKCSYGNSCRFQHRWNNCDSTDHGTASCNNKKERRD